MAMLNNQRVYIYTYVYIYMYIYIFIYLPLTRPGGAVLRDALRKELRMLRGKKQSGDISQVNATYYGP